MLGGDANTLGAGAVTSLRVEAKRGVADFVKRDGVNAAAQHGQNAPSGGEGMEGTAS